MMPLLSALRAKLGFLLVAIVCCGVSAVIAYKAIGCAASGTAIYREPSGPKGSIARVVTRESAPSEFRQVTDQLWASSILLIAVGAISFLMYRKIDDVQ
jgi:hypothetical protein